MERQASRLGDAERSRHPGANAGVGTGPDDHHDRRVDRGKHPSKSRRQRGGDRRALDHLGVDQLAVRGGQHAHDP
jgi:hypothetical protein